jgi:hypothetical protein
MKQMLAGFAGTFAPVPARAGAVVIIGDNHYETD